MNRLLYILVPLFIFNFSLANTTLLIFIDKSMDKNLLRANLNKLKDFLEGKKTTFLPDNYCQRVPEINEIYFFYFGDGKIEKIGSFKLEISNSNTNFISQNKNDFIYRFPFRDFNCQDKRENFYKKIISFLDEKVYKNYKENKNICPNILNTLKRVSDISNEISKKGKYVSIFILSPMENKGSYDCPYITTQSIKNKQVKFPKKSYIYLYMDRNNISSEALNKIKEFWSNYLKTLKENRNLGGYEIHTGYIEMYRN